MAEIFVPKEPVHNGPPVVLATTDSEAKEYEADVMNTNKAQVNLHQDVGEIVVNPVHLQVKEASDMLHKVTLMEEKELHEAEQ